VEFLIDAHLPQASAACLQTQATRQFTLWICPIKMHRATGSRIEVSIRERRVVVTKDTDFDHSHLLQGRPWKLVSVGTGNLGLKATERMFETHLPAIEAALQTCTLVELDQNGAIPYALTKGAVLLTRWEARCPNRRVAAAVLRFPCLVA